MNIKLKIKIIECLVNVIAYTYMAGSLIAIIVGAFSNSDTSFINILSLIGIFLIIIICLLKSILKKLKIEKYGKMNLKGRSIRVKVVD